VSPGLRSVALLDDPFKIVYPTAWAPLAGVEALLGRPWVDGPPGSAARRALDRVAAHHDATLDRPHECLEFPAALALVSAGLAAAVIPGLALPADPAPVRLVVLDAPEAGARRIDLVHRRGRHEPGPAAELVAQAIAVRAARLRR